MSQKATILIVSGDPDFSGMLELLLTTSSHEVRKVFCRGGSGTVQACTARIQALKPHLVIADLTPRTVDDCCPIVSALQSAPTTSQVPVIVLTTLHPEDARELFGQSANVAAVLSKPFYIDELERQVSTVLD
jgi:DNA-binding response OmpR family regulator